MSNLSSGRTLRCPYNLPETYLGKTLPEHLLWKATCHKHRGKTTWIVRPFLLFPQFPKAVADKISDLQT
jgi:hypothetical protein